jgi:hypothetical protein
LVVLSSAEDARQGSGAKSSREGIGWVCNDGHCDQGFKNQTDLATDSPLVLVKTMKTRKISQFFGIKFNFQNLGEIERFSGLLIGF